MKYHFAKTAFSLLAMALVTLPAFTNNSGAPVGKTGSPISIGQTCNSCHSGPSVSTQYVVITSDIPNEGYLDNTPYTITVTSNAGTAGMSKAGFEASVEKVGSHQGSLTGANGSQIKQSNFATHTSNSTSVSGGTRSWDFIWNSSSGSDSVRVYVSGLFANGNNQNSGDVLVNVSQEFKKSHVGLGENARDFALTASPNPAQEVLRLSAPDTQDNGLLTVVDATGRIMISSPWNAADAAGRLLNVSTWTTGIYTANIALDGGKRGQVRFQVYH